MSIQPLTGACFCKSLPYTIQAKRKEDCTLSAFCHCSKCQVLNGAPYVWTTHWVEDAITWSQGESKFTSQQGQEGSTPSTTTPSSNPLLPNKPELPRTMQTFETMPGRKWKIRCRVCGTPLGSWNEAKREWTIWPPSLDRPTVTRQVRILDPNGSNEEATATKEVTDVGSVEDLSSWFRPTHHMFFGPWRTIDLNDGLPAYLGYQANSERVK
ncbi:hypothetical protein V8E36_005043 [Tilletia maclaganii]